MIKLEVHPQVLMSLSQAFPTPNMAATKALNKYVQVLEKLLFEAWLRGPTPEQRKLELFGLSLYQLMTKGGQIGPNKIRIHKWLKDQKLELVQAVTKGSNLTGCRMNSSQDHERRLLVATVLRHKEWAHNISEYAAIDQFPCKDPLPFEQQFLDLNGVNLNANLAAHSQEESLYARQQVILCTGSTGRVSVEPSLKHQGVLF